MKRLGLDVDKLKKLYYQCKMKPSDIAKHFNCSEGAVRNEMVRQDFILRGIKEAHAHLSGDANPAWKGGKYKSKGYTFIFNSKGQPKKRHIREHIFVWEQGHGKPLPKGWIIHHLNGIKDDNRFENLYAMQRAGHSRLEMASIYKKRIRQLEKELKEVKNGIHLLV